MMQRHRTCTRASHTCCSLLHACSIARVSVAAVFVVTSQKPCFLLCFPFSTSCSRITALGPRQQHFQQPHMWAHTAMRLARRSSTMYVQLCSPSVVLLVPSLAGMPYSEIRRDRQCAETQNMHTRITHVLQLVVCLQHRACVCGSDSCSFLF
jgi:hypothetical protein